MTENDNRIGDARPERRAARGRPLSLHVTLPSPPFIAEGRASNGLDNIS